MSVEVVGSGIGEVGSVYTLTCTVTLSHRARDSSVSILWQGPSTDEQTVIMPGDQTMVKETLSLDSLTLAHGGRYICMANYTVCGERVSSSDVKQILLISEYLRDIKMFFMGLSGLVYNTLRNDFMCKLRGLLGDRFEHFESLDSFEKASFVLGSVLWEDDLSSMLDCVKDYIVDVWELRKARLLDENLSIPQSQCQNASGELGDVVDGSGLRCLHGKVNTTISCMCTCNFDSIQCFGCVVYGPGAITTI